MDHAVNRDYSTYTVFDECGVLTYEMLNNAYRTVTENIPKWDYYSYENWGGFCYGEPISEKTMENIGKRVKLKPTSEYYTQMVGIGIIEFYNKDYGDHFFGTRWVNGNFYYYRISDLEFLDEIKESKSSYTNQIAQDLAKLK